MGRFLSCAVLVALAGCGEELVVDVTIDADPCTAGLTQRLVVRVLDVAGEEVDVFERSDDLEFPTGVRVVSSAASTAWQVEVEAFGEGDAPIGFQRATGTFDASTRALLLDDRCLGVECSEGTCIAGTCSADVFATVTPNAMPETCPAIRYADANEGVAAPCGTLEAPCARAQDAVGELELVGGVAFLAGTFRGGAGSQLLHIAGARIVVRDWPGRPSAVLDCPDVDQCINVDGVDVVIDGIEVRNGRRHGINVNGDENLRVTVRNCDIHGNGNVYDMDDMFPDTHAGVSVNNGASEVLVENNFIHDHVSTSGFRLSGVGANLVSGGDRVGSIFVRNNRIERNTIGIHTNNAGDGANVIDNLIRDNETSGVSFDGGGEIRGNRICGHAEDGIFLRGDATVTFNTIVDSAGAGIRFTGDDEWVVARNIIAFNGSGLEGDGSDPTDGPNLYFMNGIRYDGIEPDMEAADIVGDPRFVMRDDCSLEIMDGPARGDTPETSFGARP